jgi:hypothetical protein
MSDVIHLPDDRQRTKKVTSGSNNRKRHHREIFRTDDTERAALRERLRVSGLSLAEYLMQLGGIAPGAKSRPRRRGGAVADDTALMQALVALNRVGNNQNQIARSLNELVLIARELGNARLESKVQGLGEVISNMPALFAEPVAAIMAALNP